MKNEENKNTMLNMYWSLEPNTNNKVNNHINRTNEGKNSKDFFSRIRKFMLILSSSFKMNEKIKMIRKAVRFQPFSA